MAGNQTWIFSMADDCDNHCTSKLSLKTKKIKQFNWEGLDFPTAQQFMYLVIFFINNI